MLQNVILGLAGSKEKPADPVDFVIHGDAGRSEIVSRDQEANQAPTPEERRESQQAMIDALKSAYPRKE